MSKKMGLDGKVGEKKISTTVENKEESKTEATSSVPAKDDD